MNTKMTFTAFLKDEYTKNFSNLAGKTNDEIKKIERDLGKLGKTGKTVRRSIDELDKRIQLLTRVRKLTVDTKSIKYATDEIKKLQKEKDKLEGKSGGGGGGSSIWNMAAGMGIAQFAPRAFSMATGFIGDAIKANMEREQQRVSLGVMMGGQKEADQFLQRLVAKASVTPFGTNDLLKSSQTMLGFGVDKREVLPIMDQLGDISGGNAERFQSLTLAFSQMSAAGRLTGQDLLQMVNAGFNPLNEISKETGKSMKQLKKDMENGEISIDMVKKAMTSATSEGGRFYGMMEKQSQTTGGRVAALTDNYNEMSIALGERLKPETDSFVEGLSNTVAMVKKWVEVPTSEKLVNEATNLRVLQAELNATNTTEQRRQEILKKLNEEYGITISNIGKEKDAYSALNTEINNTVSAILNKSKVERMKEGLKDIDDRIMGQTNSRSTFYWDAVKSSEKALGDDVVSKITSRQGLSDVQQLQLMLDAVKQKGGQTRAQSSLEAAINELPKYESGISLLLDKRAKQKSSIEETMKNLGVIDETPGFESGRVARAGSGASASGASSGSSKSKADPSISGGPRITHVNITIDSLVKGGVNITTSTLKEGTAETHNAVVEALLTAVNDANLVAGKD